MSSQKGDLRGYGQVKAAAAYAGVSVRTFRDWLKIGLPHFRLSTGTILVSYADIDEWLERFRTSGNKVDEIVAAVCRDF